MAIGCLIAVNGAAISAGEADGTRLAVVNFVFTSIVIASLVYQLGAVA